MGMDTIHFPEANMEQKISYHILGHRAILREFEESVLHRYSPTNCARSGE